MNHRYSRHYIILLLLLLILVNSLEWTIASATAGTGANPESLAGNSGLYRLNAAPSAQNLTSYYCPTPEERVYISFGTTGFNPAVLSVGVGAFVIWNGFTTSATHTVTANATANGSLPFFNDTVRPMDQWGYTFTVPGTYHYYDSYYPSNKGEVIVHSPILVGGSTLGVDMNPQTKNIVESQLKVNSSSFQVSIVTTNPTNLSSWEVCLQYDPSILQAIGVTLAPEWDAAHNPNALGIGSINSGDGVIAADSYILNGAAGPNVTAPETLFSVSFNAIKYGLGSLQLNGYLLDSNGNYIQYSRQNGHYLIIPTALLLHTVTYTGTPYPGATITLRNAFSNQGQNLITVTSTTVTTDFGTFQQSTGLPLNLTSFTNAALTMPLTIPSSASIGQHQVMFQTSWQFLRQNQSDGSMNWIQGPLLRFSGTVTVEFYQPPPPTATAKSSAVSSALITISKLLGNMISSSRTILIVTALGVWAALVLTALGLVYRQNRQARPQRAWS